MWMLTPWLRKQGDMASRSSFTVSEWVPSGHLNFLQGFGLSDL